jgi:KaiC/GvpD/RAD55 family RecA-like ATPase
MPRLRNTPKVDAAMPTGRRPCFVTLFFVLLSLAVLCSPAHAQSGPNFEFNSIRVTVDLVSPRLAHVTREVSILFQSGNWTYLDWGLWYQGKTVTVTKVFDNTGNLGFVYPTPGSPSDQPVLRILFPKTFISGEVYNFTYAYNVSSDQDSFTWSETLDSSQILIQSLTVTIKLPIGYRPTGVQPTSAAVTQVQDGRDYVTWTGTNLSGIPSVGLALGFNAESPPLVYNPASLLPYAGAIAAFAGLGVYGFRRSRISKRRRVEPEVVLENKAKELAAQAPRETVPTGLPVLDYLLKGGLPMASATLLTSPASDERENMVRRFLEAGAKMGGWNVYLTREFSKVTDLLTAYPSNLSTVVTRTEDQAPKLPNVRFSTKLENLTAINIDLMALLQSPTSEAAVASKRLCIDVLDDMLLIHKSVVTRKWLTENLRRVKALGFTVLATLNPQIHTPSDIQAILEMFDGHVELSEREIDGNMKRVLHIRKMFQWSFLDTEAVLDREKTF